MLEALVLNVRFWCILKAMALICVFSILTFVKKKVILQFNIYKENIVYYCFKIKTVHYEGLL